MDTKNKNQPITFEIAAFLADRSSANRAPRTVAFYEEKLGYWVRSMEAASVRSMAEITPEVMRAYFDQLREGHNLGGVHGYWRTLNVFLNWYGRELEDEGWTNPLKKLTPPERSHETIPGVPMDVIRAMLKTCQTREWMDVRDKALIMLLYDSGLRREEFLNLHYGDIDIKYGMVRVRNGKGRKSRVSFFGNKTRQELVRYLRGKSTDLGAPLWYNRYGTRMHLSCFREILRRRSIRAGIAEEPSPHDFRRACSVAMWRLGVREYAIQMILGHAIDDITIKYLALSPEDLRQEYKSPVDNL